MAVVVVPSFASATCVDGWTSAPEGATFGSKCYKSTIVRSKSLRECVNLCGDDAAPVCIGERAEADWLAANVGMNGYHWLGVYQNDTDGGVGTVGTRANVPALGWNRCVSGDAPPNMSAIAKWLPVSTPPEPNDRTGIESCAVLDPAGFWHDVVCDTNGLALPSYPCLCASPCGASAIFTSQDWPRMEAAVDTWAAYVRSNEVPRLSAVLLIVTLMPIMLYMCCSAVRRSRSARGGSSNNAQGRLAAAQRSAPRRKMY